MSDGSAREPPTCPSCGTQVPEGSVRCPACGRVFGEDNRCPSCYAIAGVLPSPLGGYVCAACSAPRTRREGTVVLSGRGVLPPGVAAPRVGPSPPLPEEASRGPVARPEKGVDVVAARGRSAGLRLLGAGSLGVGVLSAAALAILVPGATGLALAAAMGAFFVAVGALSLRAGATESKTADRKEQTKLELAILDLAVSSDGDLTVTEVARGLAISVAEADAALTALADGSRVGVEVDPEGVVHYVFRELREKEPANPRVRVDASIAPREAVEEAVEVAEREVEETRRRES